jgi:hypothetical protein
VEVLKTITFIDIKFLLQGIQLQGPSNTKEQFFSFFFFLWLYSPLWTLTFIILPQIFVSHAFFHHVSTFNNFTKEQFFIPKSDYTQTILCTASHDDPIFIYTKGFL